MKILMNAPTTNQKMQFYLKASNFRVILQKKWRKIALPQIP